MSIFHYEIFKGSNTNALMAAYRWAITGEDTPTVIYVYKNNTVLKTGGKYRLISTIYRRVRREGFKEELTLYRDDNSIQDIEEPDELYDEEEYEYYSDVTAIEYTDELLRKNEEILQQELEEARSNKSKVAKVIKRLRNDEVSNLVRYIRDGWKIDYSSIPVTMEVYSECVGHTLKMKPFDEDYDVTREDSGSGYLLHKYVLSILSTSKRFNAGNSFIDTYVKAIKRNFIINEKQKIMYLTPLEKIDDESNSFYVDKEAENLLSKNKIDPYNLVEMTDSYKEIFCVFAIADVLCKSTLWELINTDVLKAMTTPTSSLYGDDIDIHTYISQFKEKFILKDCDNSRNNREFLKENFANETWLYQAIVKVIRFLTAFPTSYIKVYTINHAYLKRTDLIRSCNSIEEFFNSLVTYTEPEDELYCKSLSREAIICEKLNLSKNLAYLTYKDMAKLALAKVSELPELLERTIQKIQNAKLLEKRYDNLTVRYNMAIQRLSKILVDGIDTGEVIDLTDKSRRHNLADFTFPMYTAILKPNSFKNTQQKRCLVEIRRNGIAILDSNRQPISAFQGLTINDLQNFAVAELTPIGKALTPERRKEIEAEIEKYEQLIQNNEQEKARLVGQYNVYIKRNIAMPVEYTERKAFILNKWVNKLVKKHEVWKLKQHQEAQRNPNYRYHFERILRNQSLNMEFIQHECAASFANNYKSIKINTKYCHNWYLINNAKDASTSQHVNIYQATSDGGKLKEGSIPVAALVHKKGVYVVFSQHMHAIIPTWYGCMTQNVGLQSEYYTNIRCFSKSLLSIINNAQNFYLTYKNNEEELNKFSQETGIFFLSPEEAFETVEELLPYKNSILLDVFYHDKMDIHRAKFVYYDEFVLLATLANVKLDNPDESYKELKNSKINIPKSKQR